MSPQQIDPYKVASDAAESLSVIGGVIRGVMTSNEPADEVTANQRDHAQLVALAHLNKVTDALQMLDSLLHLLSHINRPALEEAHAEHIRCLQESAGQVH